QFPPFFIWGLAAFFKVLGTSLFALRLFPALLSLGALVAGYRAARLFFPPRLAFLAAAFLAVGFWPILAGRFSHPGVLAFFWEMLALWALGSFLKRPSLRGAFLLGLATGLGFYTFTSWPVAALVVGAAFFFQVRPLRTAKALGLAFAVPLCLALALWGWRAWQEGYGGYLARIFFAGQLPIFSVSH